MESVIDIAVELRAAVRCSRGPCEHINDVLPPGGTRAPLTVRREVQLAIEHTALPCADRMRARQRPAFGPQSCDDPIRRTGAKAQVERSPKSRHCQWDVSRGFGCPHKK